MIIGFLKKSEDEKKERAFLCVVIVDIDDVVVVVVIDTRRHIESPISHSTLTYHGSHVAAPHYGTKPGHFETSKIHFPMSEGVSKVSERANE